MRSFVHEQSSSRVRFGTGALDFLGSEIERLSVERGMLVANGSALQAAEKAERSSGGRVADRIIGVRQHVPIDDARAAATRARENEIDGLIAVGGGSAIGLTKAVALESRAPVIAIPTTYSGSEMTPIYGITSSGAKRTGRDEAALPRAVIYDPALTIDLPPEATAETGMNAIAHAVEALYAKERSPIVEILAVEAIGALAEGLKQVTRAGTDIAGRELALYGAYLAGSALAMSDMALHHAISHVLGGSFGLSHGAVNAVMLPHVVAFNEQDARESVARVARILGSDDAPMALFDLARSLNASQSLYGLGLDREALRDVAESASNSVRWNPREVTSADVLEILEKAYDGRPPR
jgi:maleylacetate reductase